LLVLGRKQTICYGNTSFGRQEKAITQHSSWTGSTLLGRKVQLQSSTLHAVAHRLEKLIYELIQLSTGITSPPTPLFALPRYTSSSPSEVTEKGSKIQFTLTLFSTLFDIAGHLIYYSFFTTSYSRVIF